MHLFLRLVWNFFLYSVAVIYSPIRHSFFTHVACRHTTLLEQTPTGLVWYTNVAAISLFWNANMAAVTSCENALDLYAQRLRISALELVISGNAWWILCFIQVTIICASNVSSAISRCSLHHLNYHLTFQNIHKLRKRRWTNMVIIKFIIVCLTM